MRRSREEAAETRRKIVSAASRLFRARGIADVSVADVMSAVDMTVGGFYRHFESKDALVAEAIDEASQESTAKTALAGAESARAVLHAYLSEAHRAERARGCPVAALCSEVAHESRSTRHAFTVALDRLIETVARTMPNASRPEQLHIAAALVGGLVLSRAVPDTALAREILDAAIAGIEADARIAT